MNNWMCVLRYDDGRIFINEQGTAKDAEAKGLELMRQHGSVGLTVFITEIHAAIRG